MKLIIIFLLIPALLLASISLPAQEEEEMVNKLIGNILENPSGEEQSGESLLFVSEELESLRNHPININSISSERLIELNLIDFSLVKKIADYRREFGYIYTPYELLALPGFNEEIVSRLTPFFTFGKPGYQLNNLSLRNGEHRLLMRMKLNLPVAREFKAGKAGGKPDYQGPPVSSFMRYKAIFGDRLEIGFVADHDAGEPFMSGVNPYGFDFYSGYLALRSKKLNRLLVVGDYHLRFGQGITLWSGGGVGFGSSLFTNSKNSSGIRPYASSDENNFFRGVALSSLWGRAKISLFLSAKNRDANLLTDPAGIPYFITFQSGGMHRTGSEIEDKRVVGELVTGVNFTCLFENLKIGCTYLYQQFDQPVRKGSSAYKQHSFEGTVNRNAGIDYLWIRNGFSLFGEFGGSANRAFSWVQGAIWKINPAFACSFIGREYSSSYQGYYTGAFGQGSGARNERGVYMAMELLPVKKVSMLLSADHWLVPWSSYQSIFPVTGSEWSAKIYYRQSRRVNFYLQMSQKSLQQKAPGTQTLEQLSLKSTQKIRAHVEWNYSPALQFRSRIERVAYQFDGESEVGWLVFQDLIWAPASGFKSWFRVAGFYTGGYDSRVYSFENDLLSYFAVPEFHGKGIRSYLCLKWQPCRALLFYLKGGWTHQFDLAEESTQLKDKADLKVQLVVAL